MQFDIRRFDIYRKIPKDLTQPTTTGAAISLICITFISTLLLIELYYFITPDVVSELFVDVPESGIADRIPVHLDVTVLGINCPFLGIDIQDDLGRHEVGFLENTVRTPDNSGAGCRINATFKIARVPGNFHISTHSAAMQPANADMKHVIHDLTFGDSIKGFRQIPNRRAFHPLRRFNNTNRPNDASHDYLMKIVPTIYENLRGLRRYPYQFTFFYREYTPHQHGMVPAIWFRYDIIPITVKYTERRQKFYAFITSICAVVGGSFTVASILDSLIFTASELFKKFELGKMT
ncbi:unnamed protein product [Rotaria socialis]|uniref:Endoplasmic reticulum-Golgi intermediate compartment protein 1 n=2 Tax=Rotaria TaxID=231623 RepID=A0A820Y2F5_9BILA|nr:unnamed protein product [Rotaria socialis]CAF3355124.1 unnamed protein product [Rotaria socialis]CAF3368575.1 unnamed protein product [Rotaria socialis]CAF4314362.1 unnamed protein product [Rotaria socialis]CAF4437417.1 unnamed protein product [Rotaria socialis]